MLILAITTLVIFTLIAWTDFRRAMIVFVALLPTYMIRFQIGPLPTTLLELLWVVLVGVWLVKRYMHVGAIHVRAIHELPLQWDRIRPWLWPCGLWLVAGMIGIVVSPDIRAALGVYKAYFIEPIFFFGLLISASGPDGTEHPAPTDGTNARVRPYIQALLVSGTAVACYALVQKFVLGPDFLWEGVRATSVYPFPNAVGLFLGPLVVLASRMAVMRVGVGLAPTQHRATARVAPTLAYTFAALLMLAAIVVAESEGALVGIAAGFFFLGIVHRRTRLATIVATVTFVVAVIITPAVRGPVMEKLTLRDWSGTVRRLTWEETTAMLKDRPLFGAGLSGYPARLTPYHHYKIEIFQYPHQLFLNLWSEVGVLGIIAFGWILVTFVRVGVGLAPTQSGGDGKGRPYPIVAFVAMITLLVHGLVDVPYFKNDLAFLFWIIIALGAGFTKTEKSATVAAQ